MSHVHLLTIIQSDSDKEYHFTSVHADRQSAEKYLNDWVYEQNKMFNEDPSDDIDEYFATSEDTYKIEEREILELV